MTKDQKGATIAELTNKLANSPFMYITDAGGMNVETVNKFRRICHKQGLEFRVVKNTLLRKAMEANGSQFDELHQILHGETSIIFTETGNLPAKILLDFRKQSPKPVLKGAFIDSAIFLGDDQLDTLRTLKSKEDLVGEIIGLLQSPAKNVISALQSGGNKLAGILKTLQERES